VPTALRQAIAFLESPVYESGSPENSGLRSCQLYNSIGYEDGRVKRLLKRFVSGEDVDLAQLYEEKVMTFFWFVSLSLPLSLSLSLPQCFCGKLSSLPIPPLCIGGEQSHCGKHGPGMAFWVSATTAQLQTAHGISKGGRMCVL
jgi:hypothetical protein